jgi:hypothetical protein
MIDLSDRKIQAELFVDYNASYLLVRSSFWSSLIFVASGISCVYLRGKLAPVILCLVFQNLGEVNDKTILLFKQLKEVRERLFSL